MGKLYDSLLSGTSGRTGRIVVANVFGNEITRIRPRKRTSPPSAKQILVQNRMKRCVEFMQSYLVENPSKTKRWIFTVNLPINFRNKTLHV